MTGPAYDALDPEIGCVGPDRDAVIAGLDSGLYDRHPGRLLHVYAVRVGAVPRRHDVDSPHRHAGAPQDHHVEQLAVHRCQPVDLHVPRIADCQ